MRHTLLTLLVATALAACGSRHDAEPVSPPRPAPHEAEPVHEPVPPPTGVRPLEPGEPATPDLTGTGGGPGANSVAGVTRAARALFERCWVDAMRSGTTHGEVSGVVTMHALADGSVSAAHASLSGTLPDGFAECIERTGKEVRFPVTSAEHDVTVPLTFQSG